MRRRILFISLLAALVLAFKCPGPPQPPLPPSPKPVLVEVCAESLKLATNACPERKTVSFLPADVPMTNCLIHEAFPLAPDYDGQLIGMSCYELTKHPIEDIEWFLRELVKAGGNTTEVFPVATWNDMWKWQPYAVAKWETEMWKDKPWNPDPAHAFPVFDLNSWNEEVWTKYKQIFSLAKKMNLTLMVRIQDYCSRKENYLERHWCFWSYVQNWRWGGPVAGGYLPWAPGDEADQGHKLIWPHYDRFNARLIKELNNIGCKYFLTDWNELYFTFGGQEPADTPSDPKIYQWAVHEWFLENFIKHGCPPDRVMANPERGRKDGEETTWLAAKIRALGARLEVHGCASPEAMREIIRIFGAGRHLYPNGDGPDPDAKGINDGRPGYTEPSFDQAVEMGRIIKEGDLLGYLYKGRKFRQAQNLRAADFVAVRGLAEGMRE